MTGILRALFIVLAAVIAATSGTTELLAQSKPRVTTLGPDGHRPGVDSSAASTRR